MPFTLSEPHHSELLIKKSRFIGCVEPVSGRDEAVERVTGLRAEHPGARHVCWALMAGGQSAANDDGEPSGTAGRPMLDVLRHQELEGVLATAVRYFGGIKLGAGGLVRAYTDTVAQALRDAERVPLIRTRALLITVPYTYEGAVRRELEARGATLEAVRHGADVELTARVAEGSAAAVIADINDASQGRAELHLDV
ncbi:IMPACT family protein [Agromyces aerolatus]|uniref:IMPACT family protein n=1 Tax=Agromyces sp. LY-1074 TaxID=3074080 RepID=UPI00285C7DD9|nr:MULTISPECIES: YigZ family protein [unclassified Agromyces]MDR5698878.1 YigZ family protein [Agromyces sp. LY-1074]MDR5705344.1 YigZ family protein [Agromyces sp. LY-1358]